MKNCEHSRQITIECDQSFSSLENRFGSPLTASNRQTQKVKIANLMERLIDFEVRPEIDNF